MYPPFPVVPEFLPHVDLNSAFPAGSFVTGGATLHSVHHHLAPDCRDIRVGQFHGVTAGMPEPHIPAVGEYEESPGVDFQVPQ